MREWCYPWCCGFSKSTLYFQELSASKSRQISGLAFEGKAGFLVGWACRLALCRKTFLSCNSKFLPSLGYRNLDSLAGISFLHTGDSFPYLETSLTRWKSSFIPVYARPPPLQFFRAKLPQIVYTCYLSVSIFSHFTSFLHKSCLN